MPTTPTNLLGALVALLSLVLAGCSTVGTRPAPDAIAAMRCGTQAVHAEFFGDTLRLTVGDAVIEMRRVRSGSGARYEVPGDPTTSFWTKGDHALLEIRGEGYPECARAQMLVRADGPGGHRDGPSAGRVT
ncbi:MAG: MliC family protein [Ectothiorhodospiraceae bacterium]|nr:MliC family protein [Ectothiorhodospiraceae bacterium]